MKSRSPSKDDYMPEEEKLNNEQSKLLDNIFIAISEFLVAEMIKQSETINYYTFENRELKGGIKKTFSATKTDISQEILLKIGDKKHNVDSQSKIDVLLSTKEKKFHAIEVKAGMSGPVESPSAFVSYCKKNKVRFHKNKENQKNNENKKPQKVAGCMSSILAHLKGTGFTQDYEIRAVQKTDNGDVKHQDIEKEWYLCLRNKAFWDGKLLTNEDKLFTNCRIFFINELAKDKDKFKDIVKKMVPFFNNETFADQMWERANPCNEEARIKTRSKP